MGRYQHISGHTVKAFRLNWHPSFSDMLASMPIWFFNALKKRTCVFDVHLNDDNEFWVIVHIDAHWLSSAETGDWIVKLSNGSIFGCLDREFTRDFTPIGTTPPFWTDFGSKKEILQ